MSNSQVGTIRTAVTWQRHPAESFGGLLSCVAQSLLRTLLLWQQRASERSRLALLSDRDLADVGLKRSDLKQEIEKPFWQP